MTAQFTEKYSIAGYECDADNRLKISALFNHLQETSENFANAGQFGYETLNTSGKTWMIRNYDLQIDQLPVIRDKVRMDVEIEKLNRFRSTFRNRLLSKDGLKCLVDSVCQFVLLDKITHKPLHIKKTVPQVPAEEKLGPDGRIVFDDMPDFEAGVKVSENRRTVAYEHIDFNQHMNNSYYSVFALEGVASAIRQAYDVRRIRVSYNMPAEQGDEIIVQSQTLTRPSVVETRHRLVSVNYQTEFARLQFLWQGRQRLS
ncbi:MAG: hypothetical protein IJV07_04805 [Alphaproteobacteria bacterium]|nr:hypothetical protein [Alphaproteobacteria bacterium]